MGGDFNARSGSNMEDINDDTFSNKDVNHFLNVMEDCLKQSVPDIRNNNNLYDSRMFHFKTKMTWYVERECSCDQIFKNIKQFDEFRDFFKQNKGFLTHFSTCNAQNYKKLAVLDHLYSEIEEATLYFLPSFCFSSADIAYGCHKHKETPSFTDRIFYATKMSMANLKNIQLLNVVSEQYSANVLGFSSDHAFVYGIYEIQSTHIQSHDDLNDLINPMIENVFSLDFDDQENPCKSFIRRLENQKNHFLWSDFFRRLEWIDKSQENEVFQRFLTQEKSHNKNEKSQIWNQKPSKFQKIGKIQTHDSFENFGKGNILTQSAEKKIII